MFLKLIVFIKKIVFKETFPGYMNKKKRYSQFAIGDFTYGNPIIRSWGLKPKVTIGKFCSIASNVKIFLGGEHRTDWVTTYPFSHIFEEAAHIKGHPTDKGDITVGNDVWIGEGALILSGVTIGDGAVIGAMSVVTNNVDPYEIVAGNPAKHIQYRFDEQTIRKLLQIKWWNWSIEKIKGNFDYLLQTNIDSFISMHEEHLNHPADSR